MNAVWLVGALGLLVGFLIGVVFRDALDLYRASRKESPMPPSKSNKFLTVGLAVAVLLQLVAGGLLIVTRNSVGQNASVLADYAACNGRWQQAFSLAYTARVKARVPAENALDDVVTAVAKSDREGFKDAVTRYVHLRNELEKSQRANPLPSPPETVCGKPGDVP